MITLADKIKAIYPDIDLISAIRLQDDGQGMYVAYWGDIRPQPTAQELEDATLPLAKALKLEEILKGYTLADGGGFISNALGADYTYDSTLEHQLNLIGAVGAGIDMPYPCTDSNGIKNRVFHTASQLSQVYLDGITHKQTQSIRFYARKAEIESATTLETLDSVVW